LNIKMVCLEDGITAYGFRKMTAFVERVNEDTTTHYISTNVNRSVTNLILSRYGGLASEDMLDEMADGLADADMIGFSSMTGYADLTKSLIAKIRMRSRTPFIIWGGIHPIIHPEDAIEADVDAICTGEGEFAFQEFFENFREGKDFTGTRNFWFKNDGRIARNAFLPLMSPDQMDTLPFAKYGENELIYKSGQGFVPAGVSDYLASNGLAYNMVWSIGCPFHCTFCGNTKFIANDKKYTTIRHPSVPFIIGEVKDVLRKHPHVSTINFHDDSFLALPLKEITEFSEAWRQEIQIPFAVYGVIPNYVKEEKLEVLTWAGLNRIRMGIQSGSARILEFYKRPTPVKRVEEAAAAIAKFSKYQIPPAFDIIVDNPLETKQDVVDTLELAYRLPRPYVFYIYSLRVIPNTVLEKQMKDEGVDLEQINAYYAVLYPSLANALLYLITFWKPPRWLFDRFLRRVEARQTPQKQYPRLVLALRSLYLLKRAYDHMRFMDFSVITGKVGYVFWRLGIISFWRRFLIPRMPRPAARVAADRMDKAAAAAEPQLIQLKRSGPLSLFLGMAVETFEALEVAITLVL
jgi:anaerobic magnesium-protoporphyrin IX monomethyl ester cyclase